MYKYRCVVSDNADEKAFCEVIDKVKELYPNYIENEAENSEDTPMEHLIKIPLANEKSANVCVKIDRSEKESGQVIVMTDTYLDGLFSEIYFSSPPLKRSIRRINKNYSRIKKSLHIKLSIAFLILNIIASAILHVYVFEGHPYEGIVAQIIIDVILIAVYVKSAFIIKRKYNISLFDISCIQIGGIPFGIILAIAFAFILIDRGWDAYAVLILCISYARAVIPALVLSEIIIPLADKK